VVDRLKGARRRHERGTVAWDDEATRAIGATPDPATAAAREVWAAVRDLPEEQQDVLDGIYRQGKTYQVVSDETGIPARHYEAALARRAHAPPPICG
jgi:DNA-directed RNA polymerase specialized sigma24 family protein